MSVRKEEEITKEEKKQISRRDFMKATGVTAGVAGIAAVGSATPALAGEKSESAITNFAVKEVDRPPYMDYPFEGADKLERFGDKTVDAFIHPDLATEAFNGMPGIAALTIKEDEKVKKNLPGYTLLDHSLQRATWTSYYSAPALWSWESLRGTLPEGVSKWDASPEDNNKYIKKAAHALGVNGPVGIADLKEQWVYSCHSWAEGAPPIIFTDEVEQPVQTETEYLIPKSVNKVIVMLAPYDLEMQKYTPSRIAASATGINYSVMTETASKMCEFIRGLGYIAIPGVDALSLLVPQAIDAGLGELGRHGLLINPELGSNLRITVVFTDMPIAPDKPIKFGAAEFCKTCMKCADMCPSGSISKDKEPSYDIKCPSNNPGMKKWYVNTWSCIKFWVENGGDCGNCIAVCPYSKPQTWIHSVVKATSAKTSLFNSTFKVLDDALGYGSTMEDHNPSEWWEKK